MASRRSVRPRSRDPPRDRDVNRTRSPPEARPIPNPGTAPSPSCRTSTAPSQPRPCLPHRSETDLSSSDRRWPPVRRRRVVQPVRYMTGSGHHDRTRGGLHRDPSYPDCRTQPRGNEVSELRVVVPEAVILGFPGERVCSSSAQPAPEDSTAPGRNLSILHFSNITVPASRKCHEIANSSRTRTSRAFRKSVRSTG